MEQKVLRFSTVVIVVALILRLLGNAGLDFVLSPKAASWMFFLQTGRLSKPVNIESTEPTKVTTPTAPQTTPVPSQPASVSVPTFSPDDAAAITVSSGFSYQADLPALLTKPLSWDLSGNEPTVLIIHSHTTESYNSGDYVETSPYHTLDANHNMLSIGSYLADLLEKGGISVIHDTAVHDNPSYDLSYTNSRRSVQEYLKRYPSIRLVLDLHRDSYEDAAGNQVAHTVFSQGETLAPLMFVVGTDYGGLTHPQWQENLSLALKLQTQLESFCPGICRNLNLRTQRFNQDLSVGSLLIEVGASGNTHAQALKAAEVLAKGILSLAHGSK
ncbi:MAG: stage II sporulation protein P [Oscillospiraceae bacterium]|nr:stage II sporulation protein P [Oscillospiraceae bacterium]